MKITLFYSWQTETNTTYNKNFIYSCIEKAIRNLKQKPDFKEVQFILQDAVRGEPGSPAVALKINERIQNCDIFIADLSVVNQIGKITRLIQKYIYKTELRPSQNNNVINEYGIATNAIGAEKIIGVLNGVYGSPNENPNNIPFDLRHLRYPITYTFSRRCNKREEVQKDLVNSLTTAIRDTALFALQHQRNKYSPLVGWNDWERSISITERFIPNLKTDEIKATIQQISSNPKQSIRILGLSGLGKTRILLEIFRPISGNNDSALLSSRVLYVNCNDYPSADFPSVFSKLNLEQEGRILILDNCSIDIYRQALAFARRRDNKTIFISVDSNPEEITSNKIDGVSYIILKKEELSSVVDEILIRDFKGIGEENIKKIQEFSQGIPLMAVLLAESIKNGERYLGKLEDKLLLDKLLGSKGQDARNRTILKACSIFNYFGVYDDLALQKEFIAKNRDITSLDGNETVLVNDFDTVFDYYLKRGIFERKGRYLAIRPFPLAMYLAQEWLEPCTPERLVRVIEAIANLPEPSKGDLSEALSEQMRHLGYNDKANDIVEKIIGPGSPFDNAEVLNTGLGSRLFRSFVEVNPIAVSNNLMRNFYSMPVEELKSIETGRRNLIWVIEKLCFDGRTFIDGAKIMSRFAIAENEIWANNATSQFRQLFKIILSGTEATLEERWQIIIWCLGQDLSGYMDLAIQAMSTGLSSDHFSRMGGAEIQGSRTLKDFQPNWDQINVYWKNILAKLMEIVKTNNEFSDKAAEAITIHIRSIVRAGSIALIMPILEEIAAFKEYQWDMASEGLRAVKRFDSNFVMPAYKDKLENLLKKMTRTDFISQYISFDKTQMEDYENYSSDRSIQATTALAERFVNSNLSWDEALPIFYTSYLTYSFYFGNRLYELLATNQESVQLFFDKSIKVLETIDKKDRVPTVLAGFISVSTPSNKESFYNKIAENINLCYLLFYLVSQDKDGEKYFELLFDLVKNEKANVRDFRSFEYGKVLDNLDISELHDFSNRLFRMGIDGYNVVFDIYYGLGYNDSDKRKSLIPIFRECIQNIGISKREERQLDSYKWSQTICFILTENSDDDLAKFICHNIIETIKSLSSYHLDNDTQRIFEVLLKQYFNVIWPELGLALLSDGQDYIKFYGLKNILGSHIGGPVRHVGVLFIGDIDQIFNWAKENPSLAPQRLAELVPIFAEDNDDYKNWHPISLRLIDEFGYNIQVLRNLSSNMGTFSWTGSIVPLLQGKSNLFELILHHRIPEVAGWARSNLEYLKEEIRKEKDRDEEKYLN